MVLVKRFGKWAGNPSTPRKTLIDKTADSEEQRQPPHRLQAMDVYVTETTFCDVWYITFDCIQVNYPYRHLKALNRQLCCKKKHSGITKTGNRGEFMQLVLRKFLRHPFRVTATPADNHFQIPTSSGRGSCNVKILVRHLDSSYKIWIQLVSIEVRLDRYPIYLLSSSFYTASHI